MDETEDPSDLDRRNGRIRIVGISLIVALAIGGLSAWWFGDDQPELRWTCGGNLPVPREGAELGSDGEDALAILASDSLWERDIDDYDWARAEKTSGRITLFGAPKTSAENAIVATFRRDSSSHPWRVWNWGGCNTEARLEGYRAAEVFVGGEFDPASTRITLHARETACAGGQSPGTRDVRTIVSEDDPEAVSVMVFIERPQGPQDCPGNPSFQVTITLQEPLGNRSITSGAFGQDLESIRASQT